MRDAAAVAAPAAGTLTRQPKYWGSVEPDFYFLAALSHPREFGFVESAYHLRRNAARNVVAVCPIA